MVGKVLGPEARFEMKRTNITRAATAKSTWELGNGEKAPGNWELGQKHLGIGKCKKHLGIGKQELGIGNWEKSIWELGIGQMAPRHLV